MYELRHMQLIHRQGIVNVKEEVFAMEIFEEISYEQNLWGRIFGYASITMGIRHNDRERLTTRKLHYIPNHLVLTELLEKALKRNLDHIENPAPEFFG